MSYAKAQNGLDLDGSNDYIQTTYSGVSGGNSRTVEAWIKTTAKAGDVPKGMYVLKVRTAGDLRSYRIVKN